jgi:hypothetical protein
MFRQIVLTSIVLTALALLPTAVLGGDENAAAPTLVDNPVYQAWAQFQPGSSATYTCTTSTDEAVTESTLTYTLKEVTKDKVVLELKTVTASDEGDKQETIQTIACPAKIEKPAETPEPTEKGKDSVQVGDEEIDTTWSTTETTDGETTTSTTVWTSSTVPGGTIKSVTESENDTFTMTKMVLTEYKVVEAEGKGE